MWQYIIIIGAFIGVCMVIMCIVACIMLDSLKMAKFLSAHVFLIGFITSIVVSVIGFITFTVVSVITVSIMVLIQLMSLPTSLVYYLFGSYILGHVPNQHNIIGNNECKDIFCSDKALKIYKYILS
eukprot:246275_1